MLSGDPMSSWAGPNLNDIFMANSQPNIGSEAELKTLALFFYLWCWLAGIKTGKQCQVPKSMPHEHVLYVRPILCAQSLQPFLGRGSRCGDDSWPFLFPYIRWWVVFAHELTFDYRQLRQRNCGVEEKMIGILWWWATLKKSDSG